MHNLNDLYQELIIDNSQHPANFGILTDYQYKYEGYNPLCGDQVTVFCKKQQNIITEISFQGVGCAISTASASLMTLAVQHKSVEEILTLMQAFQNLVTTGNTTDAEQLGRLIAFAGVFTFPMRVKCATLAWHTLKGAIMHDSP